MNLITRNSHPASKELFSELADFQSQINDLFDFSLGRRGGSRWPSGSTAWVPAVDIHEEKERFVVKAEVPGLDRNDLNLSIEEGLLTIRGEKKEDREEKQKDVLRTERFYGLFQRAIQLPQSIDASAVKASYKNGVLEVSIPKREDAKPKTVKIDVA